MKRSVLIIASSDPRTCGDVAEAVRIAAGLATHECLAVTVCFDGRAVEALQAGAEDLLDGEFYADYLPLIAASGTILATAEVDDTALPGRQVKCNRISPEELQRLAERSERVLRF